MREICTSGSTRGGAFHGPLLLYRSSAANPHAAICQCLKYPVRSDSASFPAIRADLHSCAAHPALTCATATPLGGRCVI